jgi:hypothetical protein
MRSKLARFTLAGAALSAVLTVTAVALAADAPKMMTVDTGAKLTVHGPTAGTTVTGNSISTDLGVENFRLTCALAGTAPKAHAGHYHIELDHSLIDMFCGPKATISLLDVKPGKHTLAFVPAANDHAEDIHAEKKVSFVYKPSKPLAATRPLQFAGKPSVSIVSPKPGATVQGSFDLVVDVKNFRLSCDEYGKASVAGYGHWHVNLDTTSKGMMGMGTMMGMSCQRSFHVSLAGIKGPGKHTFYAILEDNTHAPTIGVKASVAVNVK